MLDVIRHHRVVAAGAVALVAGVGLSGLAGSGAASRQPDPRRTGAAWASGTLPAAVPAPATTVVAPPPTTGTTAATPASPPAPPPDRPAAARRPPAPRPQPPRSSPQRATTSLASAWIAAGAQNIAADAAPAAPADAAGRAPVRLEIPAIGVSAPVDPAGLNGDGKVQVPEDFARTHWYTGRPVPGDPGPAVIVGHVDNRQGPAVFYRLRELDPGDEVIVRRGDGSAISFVVERSKQVPKAAFPTEEVYGPTPDPQLRLVTCGGSFDRSSRHYRDNIIVFLRMKG